MPGCLKSLPPCVWLSHTYRHGVQRNGVTLINLLHPVILPIHQLAVSHTARHTKGRKVEEKEICKERRTGTWQEIESGLNKHILLLALFPARCNKTGLVFFFFTCLQEVEIVCGCRFNGARKNVVYKEVSALVPSRKVSKPLTFCPNLSLIVWQM